MEGTFIQLYKDSEWVAQFRDIVAAQKYVYDLGEDMNSFEIRYEPSKYKK